MPNHILINKNYIINYQQTPRSDQPPLVDPNVQKYPVDDLKANYGSGHDPHGLIL